MQAECPRSAVIYGLESVKNRLLAGSGSLQSARKRFRRPRAQHARQSAQKGSQHLLQPTPTGVSAKMKV